MITGTLNGASIPDTAHVELRHEPGDPAMTTIDADSTLLKVGDSWTTIRVTVRDEAGNRVHASAGVVSLNATKGLLGSVTDRGDGTFTARFKAGSHAGVAVISGRLDGRAIAEMMLSADLSRPCSHPTRGSPDFRLLTLRPLPTPPHSTDPPQANRTAEGDVRPPRVPQARSAEDCSSAGWTPPTDRRVDTADSQRPSPCISVPASGPTCGRGSLPVKSGNG